MPFDGVVTKAVTDELNNTIAGGRIYKVYQPERDTLILYIRSNNSNFKLLCSCNANSPRVHLTQAEYENPSYPPMFCMLLRKHLTGGIISNVEFLNYERIINIHIEAEDELGDKSIKKLIIEIMGRHSNIILTNQNGKIIDAMKHIDHDINRIREIMPARAYVLPPQQDKTSPSELNAKDFILSIRNNERSLSKILLSSVLGFSPVLCREICVRAGIEPDTAPKYINYAKLDNLANTLNDLIALWAQKKYEPCIATGIQDQQPVDFHAITLTQYGAVKHFQGISEAIDFFYRQRAIKERIKRQSSDLIHIVKQNIERCEKKIRIHVSTLEENSQLDKFRLYGELITANIYNLNKGMKSCSLLNYYDSNERYIEIPLDENLTPQENAQKYFRKYSKAKTAYAYASEQLKISRRELDYLENVLYSLEETDSIDNIEEIREELRNQGYIRKANVKRKNHAKPEPLTFTSSEGYQIWVGRNNAQNDELTLKFAKPEDLWLHTKNIPGSHVIARVPDSIPDKTLLEAAAIAAWFSKARNSSKVQVDYTRVKYVKKPPGARPGMVVYVNYNTVIVDPVKPALSG